MSLILDALDRSEQDRTDPAQVPGVHTRHGPIISAGEDPSARRWIMPAVLVLLPLFAVILWRQLSPAPVPVASPAPAAPPAQPAPVPIPAPAPVPEAAANLDPVATPAPVEVVADEPDVVEPVAVAREPTPKIAALYADRTAPVEAEPEAPQATSPAQPTAVVEPEAPESGLDVDALARAAQAELDARALSEHSVPMISELSQREKDSIPSVFYSAHRWNGSGSNSSVVLNGKAVSEGDLVGQGIEVEEILKDSVVLNYRGTRFRLRSLNSWVNL